jgi:hypothetical protein
MFANERNCKQNSKPPGSRPRNACKSHIYNATRATVLNRTLKKENAVRKKDIERGYRSAEIEQVDKRKFYKVLTRVRFCARKATWRFTSSGAVRMVTLKVSRTRVRSNDSNEV